MIAAPIYRRKKCCYFKLKCQKERVSVLALRAAGELCADNQFKAITIRKVYHREAPAFGVHRWRRCSPHAGAGRRSVQEIQGSDPGQYRDPAVSEEAG
jgi:hypothetical protein